MAKFPQRYVKSLSARETSTEGIETLGSFYVEVVHVRVDGVVLQVFEQASVEIIRATFGSECNVADLGDGWSSC